MDIDHIEPGEDFAEIINERVGSCSILIALIGRSWVTAADKTAYAVWMIQKTSSGSK